jgi:hypothetical protein
MLSAIYQKYKLRFETYIPSKKFLPLRSLTMRINLFKVLQVAILFNIILTYANERIHSIGSNLHVIAKMRSACLATNKGIGSFRQQFKMP